MLLQLSQFLARPLWRTARPALAAISDAAHCLRFSPAPVPVSAFDRRGRAAFLRLRAQHSGSFAPGPVPLQRMAAASSASMTSRSSV